MTHNQIQYQELKETTRHNVAMEMLESGKLHETGRHNVATETLESGKLQETSRHNVATEVETSKHNRVTEQLGFENLKLGYANLTETSRHNQVTEFETNRHNVQTEGIGWATVGAKMRELDQKDYINSFYPYEVETRRLSAQAQMASANAAALNANANMLNSNVNQQMMPYNMIVQDALANKYNAEATLSNSKNDLVQEQTLSEVMNQNIQSWNQKIKELDYYYYADKAEAEIWNKYLSGTGAIWNASGNVIKAGSTIPVN